MRRHKKIILQILFFLLSLIFVYVLVRQFGQLSNVVETLSKGAWYLLIAVVGIQAIGTINRGAFYNSLYDFFGVKDSLKRLMRLSLAAGFLNLAAPAAGLSGMAIFISEAQRHGMSKSRATVVNIFAYFLVYGCFILILLFGLFYLLFNHQLYQYQIITAAVLFGMLLLFVILFFAAVQGANRVKKLFEYVAAIVNFLVKIIQRRSKLIKKDDVNLLSGEVHLCLKLIQDKWKQLWLPVFHVFLWEIIDVLTLYYLFLTLRYAIYPGTLITAYAIGILFALVSITPNGVGIVEATMVIVLGGLSVPVELAAIAVVGYRVFTFWIPFILGYFAFRSFQKEKLIQIDNGSS